MKSQLKDHLENAQDWEKMETPIPGVSVVKIPATKSRKARLNLEINPLGADSYPIKRKGLFIGNAEVLLKIAEAVSHDMVYPLVKEMEIVNPKVIKKIKKLEM